MAQLWQAGLRNKSRQMFERGILSVAGGFRVFYGSVLIT